MGEERDDQQPEEPVEGVRLVNRDDAEAAIESGRAITRGSQGRLVSLVGMPSDDDEIDSSWADTDDASSSSIRILGGNSERVSSQLRLPGGSRHETSSGAAPTIDDDFDMLDIRSADDDDEEFDLSIDIEPVADDKVRPPQEQSQQLPHWTEPATGEVPGVFAGTSPTPSGGGGAGDDRDEWSLDDLSEASQLGVEEADELDVAFASLGEVPAYERSPEPGEVPADASTEKHTPIDALEEKVESLKKASIVTRTVTGVAAVVLAGLAFNAGPTYAMVLALVVVMLCAVEYFDALRRVGYRPATALGLVAVAGALLGTYARGEAAIPLVFGLATAFTFLWYLLGITRESPTANISATLLGVMWIGIFGSYSALLLREPNDRGIALMGGAVILVVAYDTFAYLGGVLFGQHKLNPVISPNKTWEGLITATVASVVIGTVVLPFIHPWGIIDGFVMGFVIAVVAPIGDLAESMIKRDLNLKDMGRLLPGHGGALDRFDALLFVLPATYYVARLLNLV